MKIEIETKFSAGDYVYFMNNNNIEKREIASVECLIKEEGKGNFKKNVIYKIPVSSIGYNAMKEKELFCSKEELLKEIMGNYFEKNAEQPKMEEIL